jgi:hypothetical protein
MYNTKFECRYYKDDVILDTDNVTENDIIFIRNYLYKEDLLNIFSINYDDIEEVFEMSINELYKKIKDCQILKEFMEKAASTIIFSTDIKKGLCILYSYDYMHITHKCISEYLDTGNISEENINLLNNILK